MQTCAHFGARRACAPRLKSAHGVRWTGWGERERSAGELQARKRRTEPVGLVLAPAEGKLELGPCGEETR